jgi:hypothetical protein
MGCGEKDGRPGRQCGRTSSGSAGLWTSVRWNIEEW